MKKKALLFFLTGLLVAVTGCGSQETAGVTTSLAESETDVEVTDEEDSTEEVVEEDLEGVNLMDNGDFSKGSEHWATFATRGGAAEFAPEEGVGKVTVFSTGLEDYSVQLYYDGFGLKMGGVYELSFDISSNIPRKAGVRIQVNGGTYDAYVEGKMDVTEEMQTFKYEFTMTEGDDPAPRLCFNLGTPMDGDGEYEKHEVYVDNVSVTLLDGSAIVKKVEVDNTVACNTNQIGFLPDARKTVVVRSANPGGVFTLVDESGKEVYNGTLSEAIDSVNAGETVYFGDFSDFTKEGTYTVVSGDGESSYPFTIGKDVYDDLLKDSFRMLYLQRCGMELTQDLAGDFAHPVCHQENAVVYGSESSETKEVGGGWHDAGDYGRYVVSGVETVIDLFLCYEDFPQIWDGKAGDQMDIPESGNGIPDILDEAKYELDWLLKMQDEATGGVYHKVTCLEFPGFVMPQEETAQLVLAPISNTATGDFAAIMAKASDIYKDMDADFANKCLAASKKAWEYLEVTPNVKGYRNPDEILTGEYPDGQDKDERFWAAAELYKVTGDQKYNAYLEETMEKYILHGFGWAEVGTYGNLAYLSMDESMQNPVYVEKMKEMIVQKADQYLQNVNTDGYRVALGDNYCWGSNQVVCNYARQMLFAESLTGKEEYNAAAYDQLSYLLGQNTLSYCFMTGYGSVSPVNMHHRPCMATGSVLKGMLVGGPDSALEDPYVKSVLANAAPAKCYADNEQSYSTNEVTVYWNSPFIYLLSSQMELQAEEK